MDVNKPVQPAPEPETTGLEIASRPTRRWRAWLFQGYVLAAVVGFGVLFVLARSVPYFAFDLRITQFIQSISAPWVTNLMVWVSFPGFEPQVYLITGMFVLALALSGLRWEAVMALVAALGVALVGTGIKLFVHRARPSTDLVQVIKVLNSYSFPSGHVLYYTAFFGFMLFLVFTLLRRSPGRNMLAWLLIILIILVGPSRIELGQHWPSDVLGAYLLGSLWLALTIYVYRWGKPRFFVHQPAAPEDHPAAR